MKNKSLAATVAALVGYSIWGFSFLFSKIALGMASPFVLLAYRYVGAFLIMNLIVLSGRVRLSLRGKPVGKLLLMGLVMPVCYFIFETYGIDMTSSSYSGIILSLIPVAGLILGRIFLKEKCTVFQVGCTVMSIIGVVLTTTGGIGTVSLLGTLLLVGGAVSTALFNTISRSISDLFTPFERTYVMFALGCVMFPAIALIENRQDLAAVFAPAAEPMFWAAVLYLAAAASVIAFMLVNYSVTYLSVARTTIFNNFSTVVSVLAGIFIMKDTFAPLQIVGIVVILLGVFGVSMVKKVPAEE